MALFLAPLAVLCAIDMLNEDDVAKIAKLAALTLTPEQLKQYSSALSNILGYMDNLNKIDVTNVQPTSHAHGSANFFRQDEAKQPLSIEDGLANAPDKSGRFIRVPIIIEQSTEH